MPVYTTLCPTCGHRDTVFRRVDERDADLPFCDQHCGTRVQRIIDKPAVHAEIAAYESPATGRMITSRAERREDLRRAGALEWEPGMRQDIERRRQELIEKDLATIDAGVDNVVRDLNASGRL